MKVVGSFASNGDVGGLAASDRLGVGEGLTTIDRKVVERLRVNDAQLRAKIRKEARTTFGAPHFIDTRGPDLGLYTIDGMVVGGIKGKSALKPSGSPQPSPHEQSQQVSSQAEGEVAFKAEPDKPAVQVVPTKGESGPDLLSGGVSRAVAAYAPAAPAKGGTTEPVGSSRDLKA